MGRIIKKMNKKEFKFYTQGVLDFIEFFAKTVGFIAKIQGSETDIKESLKTIANIADIFIETKSKEIE